MIYKNLNSKSTSASTDKLIEVTVTPDQLRKIYEALENEENPFDARVSEVAKNKAENKGLRVFRLSTSNECLDYFSNLIRGCMK